MPSPIGHALGGLAVALTLAPTHGVRNGLRARPGIHLWAPMLAACLPDIDFLWGRHNMETHSIGFAVLVGLGVWAWQRSAVLGAACALAVCTHVLFDWLGSDDAPPIGVMALWPFSDAFYFADAWLFIAIGRHYWKDTFIRQNTLAVLRELLLLVPIVFAIAHLRTRSRRTP